MVARVHMTLELRSNSNYGINFVGIFRSVVRGLEVSLAQLVGGVDLQIQHMSSNPHIHEFRFLFILEDMMPSKLVQRSRSEILLFFLARS
jgi:hypothetical protein